MTNPHHTAGEVSATDLFLGGGEMGHLIRSMDWSKTAVGPVQSWPQALKAAVRIIVGSRFPMFVWWGQAMTNFYNDSYAPMLGKRHPTALGRSAFDVWSDIWSVVGPQAEAVLNEGKSSWNEELLLVMERNAYIEEAYFTFSYSPVMDDDGRPGGIFCAVTEDTQRVLGQRRLKTLRELSLRTADESKNAEQACAIAAEILGNNQMDIPFALLYLIDSQGTRATLAGTSRLQAGTAASPLTIGLYDNDAVWPFRSVVEAGRGEIVGELTQQFAPLPAGAWPEPARQAFVLPLTKQGQTALAGFLVAGISPRLAFDNNYRDFLEVAAGQIASAIANARAYEEERKRAEALAELDRAKTVFFSNVSHEFRTPLTLMMGPLEESLAQPSSLSSQDRERIEIARRNSLRLLKLVNTLLDFSRIEAGRVEASYEPVDLSSLTADLASVFRSAIEKAGLRLIVDCAPLGEPIYVDRGMWEKIVLNLLSNALKFTFEGKVEINLRRQSDHVVLMVRDTGTGIPAAELHHVFERFYRVKNARGRSFEGSGIGLALVQELVKLHGGAVEVASAVDHGTCFTVRIPIGKSHLPAQRIQATPTPASSDLGGETFVEEALRWLPGEDGEVKLPRSSLETTDALELRNLATRIENSTPARILFADDNADMRTYVQRLLSPLYEIVAVSDGALALKAAHERKPDLILADVMMPELDGFELLKQLRADPELNRTPIILLSARAGEESRVEGMEAGADDYLIKPFSARELLARVRAHLEIARVRTQMEAQLRNARDSLELIVAERTRDLQQANAALLRDMAERTKLEEQLLQSQKMESIAALAGGVAHDFNNILNIIQGYNSLLSQRGGADKEIQESVAVISETIKRGSAVVQQLLTAARKNSGIELRSVDANALIEKFLPLIKETFPKTISINYSAEPHLPLITADQNQIEQALLNLCVNARDAMPDGGALTLRTASADGAALQFLGDSEGLFVCIEVTDNGIGIDKAIRERIFEPFFTTKDIGQGTGLGLSVVFGIVKNHHGFIDVASELGSGTTFRLYFPVASDRAADKVADMNRDQPLAPVTGEATVLLVEDEENMRRLLERTFSRRGYRILTADTGPAALDIYQRHKKEIDIILLDMGLPGVSGREVLKKIRYENPDAKIVVTSGYIEPALKSEVQSGRVKLLHKPYTQNDLFAIVQGLIAEESAVGA